MGRKDKDGTSQPDICLSGLRLALLPAFNHVIALSCMSLLYSVITFLSECIKERMIRFLISWCGILYSILSEHAVLTLNGSVEIKPAEVGAKIKINGQPVTGTQTLVNKDRVLFGMKVCVYYFQCFAYVCIFCVNHCILH